MTSELEARVARLERVLDAMLTAAGGKPAPAYKLPASGNVERPVPGGAVDPRLKPGQVADERDMRGQYGDAPIYKDPYGWKGPGHAGQKPSTCPSDYLHALADDIDRYGVKLLAEGDADKAQWKFRDAGRARAWAIENAKHAPEQRGLPGVPVGGGARAPARDETPGRSHFEEEDPDDEIPF